MVYHYLSDSTAEAFRRYDYKGSDQSYIYMYILSPLAVFLVNNYTPAHVAPNTITLVGLLWMISSYIVFGYFFPNLDDAVAVENENAVPSWPFVLNGVAILFYQTLDNMDGKQARRTGSSNPLGLLFDHGCDAFNVILGSTNWMCAMGVGFNDENDLWRATSMVFFPLTLFFVQTWEEYHVGRLDLPVINGPNEGLLLAACQMFLTATHGVSYWYSTTAYDRLLPFLPVSLQNNKAVINLDLLLYVMMILSLQELIIKISSVVYRHGIRSLSGLIPMLSLVILPTYIFGTHATNVGILSRNPRLCLNLCSALFVEMTTGLMLDHMVHSEYQPFRWTLTPLLAWAAFLFLSNGSESFDFVHDAAAQDNFFFLYTLGIVSFLSFKIYVVMQHLCRVLGIWCFDIVTPRTIENKTKRV